MTYYKECLYVTICIFIVTDYPGQPPTLPNITEGTNEATDSFPRLSAGVYEFETTIRSCLGTFCFDEPVKRRGVQNNKKESFTRVGILFPYSSDPDSTKEINLLRKLIGFFGTTILLRTKCILYNNDLF